MRTLRCSVLQIRAHAHRAARPRASQRAGALGVGGASGAKRTVGGSHVSGLPTMPRETYTVTLYYFDPKAPGYVGFGPKTERSTTDCTDFHGWVDFAQHLTRKSESFPIREIRVIRGQRFWHLFRRIPPNLIELPGAATHA